MDDVKTVVFADLTGSTSLFDTIGNAAATHIVTRLTQWIGQVCEAQGGRVVKMLGDGVLALFPTGLHAVAATVQMQRDHRNTHQGLESRLELKIGMACGGIIEVDGDCYGDAVNVASRLADLSGAQQIWATEGVVDQMRRPPAGVRFRGLGAVPVRGKAEPLEVVRVEWQEEVGTDMMTLQAELTPSAPAALPSATIRLTCLDVQATYRSEQMPVHFGRAREAEFVLSDPRVSRLHARIDWRNTSFVLTDLSSYGTWVRFDGTTTQVPLRRTECLLYSGGEIALGAGLDDFTVPVIRFELSIG